MSQMTSLQKALKAAAKVRVFVKIATVTAKNAHAPVGRGSKTSPANSVSFSSQLGAESVGSHSCHGNMLKSSVTLLHIDLLHHGNSDKLIQ